MSNPGSQYPPNPARPSEGPQKAVKGVAPESVVQAVMKARGCERRVDRPNDYCARHGHWNIERNCCSAVIPEADAAFVASLEWAARELDPSTTGVTAKNAADLRRWARGER